MTLLEALSTGQPISTMPVSPVLAPWWIAPGGSRVELPMESPVVHAADFVVEVSASMTLGLLNEELATHGQVIPFDPATADPGATIGEHLDLNLPQRTDVRFGSWRDRLLRATVRMADGRSATSGSLVVKSVAGFDVHKMLVGARGSLAIFESVVLRTSALSAWEATRLPELPLFTAIAVLRPGQNPPTGGALDADSGLWFGPEPNEACAWFHPARAGRPVLSDPVQCMLLARAKQAMDPRGLLNPGAWGDLG